MRDIKTAKYPLKAASPLLTRVHGARNKYQEKSCMYEAIDDELQLMVLIWEWIPAMLSGDWNPYLMHYLFNLVYMQM